jgi:bifunctional non-homologous end joining protein LigD
MKGKNLEGGFVLVQFKKDDKNWLLIKHKDEYAINKKYDSEKYTKTALKKADNAK